jgi:hypothetical protein
MPSVESAPAVRGRRRVVLRCGSALYFASANFAPRSGEVIPCVRHGYCGVAEVENSMQEDDCAPASPGKRRAPRRTVAELIDHLCEADAFTLQQLRSERFTLRILSDAARAGLISIDTEGSEVLVRPLLKADPADVPATRIAHGRDRRCLGQST